MIRWMFDIEYRISNIKYSSNCTYVEIALNNHLNLYQKSFRHKHFFYLYLCNSSVIVILTVQTDLGLTSRTFSLKINVSFIFGNYSRVTMVKDRVYMVR